MKIIKNERLIKRNGTIGNWISILALVVLGGGMFVTFRTPNSPQIFSYSLIALIAGFMMTQIGMYMGNRWGRSPRPDELLDAGLKGLPGDYTIYHFITAAPHLLVGPAGVWVLIPYRQRGVLTYQKNRWRLGSGGFLQAYMSIFGQEGIGRPDLEAESEIKSVVKQLAKNLSEQEIPSVQVALVFMNEQVEIQVDGVPLPALRVKQLKDFIRQKAKEKPIGQSQLSAVKAVLPQGE